jgi:ubiquinone/menaquinone biosynthesis C-methylase UbiE
VRQRFSLAYALANAIAITDTKAMGQLFKLKDRATNWQEIWNKRNIQSLYVSNDICLEDLIIADGFDTGGGKLNSLDWEEYVRHLSKKIDLVPNDSIFEIGSGSGAFLYSWYTEGHVVGGIDYSESLVSIAQRVMRGMNFQVSEAIEVNTDEKFDIVLSNSVFQYFRDYRYAQKVIERMIMKARKAVAILEIPDLAKKEESENTRRAALPEGEYDKNYEGLTHLYYDRAWFTQFSDKSGYKLEISDHNIKDYGNSQFRFNVVIKK